MKNLELKKIMESRRSVRTFDGNSIEAEKLDAIEEYIKSVDNPFKVDVSLKIYDAKEYELSSPVIIRESKYIFGSVSAVHFAEIAYGYTLEKVSLFVESLGIGSVWLGGTFKRDNFHRAIGFTENMMMPCVMPIGKPADKMSVRETLMRKSTKSDSRKDFGELFFNKTFETPLTFEDAGILLDSLKMVRLAPSAMNKQPWRVVVNGKYTHFYKKTSKGSDRPYGDMQKVDMGIALCHFDLMSKEDGINGEFIVKVPGIAVPKDMEYIISYVIQD